MRAQRENQARSRSILNSSRHRMTYAKISKSIMLPVNEVACSQKLNCKPQTVAASTGGIHAVGVERIDTWASFRSGLSGAKSWRSKETERARSTSTTLAVLAANRFNASTASVV